MGADTDNSEELSGSDKGAEMAAPAPGPGGDSFGSPVGREAGAPPPPAAAAPAASAEKASAERTAASPARAAASPSAGRARTPKSAGSTEVRLRRSNDRPSVPDRSVFLPQGTHNRVPSTPRCVDYCPSDESPLCLPSPLLQAGLTPTSTSKWVGLLIHPPVSAQRAPTPAAAATPPAGKTPASPAGTPVREAPPLHLRLYHCQLC